MAGRAGRVDAVIGFGERGHVGGGGFGFVLALVEFAEVGVVGEVLNFALGEVAGVERLQWRAVVAHAFGPVPAHLVVACTRDLAVFLIEAVVEWELTHGVPGLLDHGRRGEDGLMAQVLRRHLPSAQRAGRDGMAVGGGGGGGEVEEDLGAMGHIEAGEGDAAQGLDGTGIGAVRLWADGNG